MNRELKFRAWDLTNSEWKNVHELSYDELFEDDKYIVQEFTGLMDNNNKDVYVGDIVSYSEYQGWEDGRTFCGIYEVKWDEEKVEYIFLDIPSGEKWRAGETCFDTVVGNIFENPEQLEENE